MIKQAMGIPSFPLHGNMRTTDHVLERTEHSLVSTILQRVDELPLKWMPSGQNCIVCVKADAHNVEDSIIMNESFIQAGGLTSYTDRTYIQSAQRNHHHASMDAEIFERPDPERTAQYKSESRYDKIDADGLPVPGDIVTSETVIIGKTGPLPTPPADPSARNRSVDRSQMHTNPNHTRRDLSTLPRKNGGGVVQSVVLSHTRDTKRVAVTVRTYRKPQIGDKFCSRHGQKGTISRVAPADELPRGLDGTVPDIIMNPHAFPSRMTAGNILEAGLGMVAAMTGQRRDGTTFFGPKMDEVSDELFAVKLERRCEQRVINPKTGELMNASLFIGQVYYQVLKHIVEEKVHARQRGPVTQSTRQPLEGRSRDGGLRYGEMEKDATIAHGAAQITAEQMCDKSDPFPLPICRTCGTIAEREPTNHESHICRQCDSRDKITKEILPYPAKQMIRYFLAMGISMRLIYGTDRSRDEKI
jgi:DNA-directed RNA polymerase II subunit RPB2